MTADLRYIGQRVKRIDGLDKALGSVRFASDLDFAGMLHGKTLRSPIPHARVLKVDTSRALQLPGVEAVLTAKDIPGENRHGIYYVHDERALAPEGDKVRYVGEPVALVAATSEKVAVEALNLIVVEYQELPVVSDPVEALRPGAVLIHEDKPGNVCASSELLKGDVEKGFSEAEVIIENTFHLPRQEHAFLEPEAGVALPDPLGLLTVYAHCQEPGRARHLIAAVLGMPESKIRVVSVPGGGAFGGKWDASLFIHLALLCRQTGRPVRMAWSREESIFCHPKRHPARIEYRMGATREGKITAIQALIVADGGAYTSASAAVIRVMGSYIAGPYNVPHIKVEGKVAFTNNPISGAMRGFGGPQAVTATEGQVDALARQLGIDPVELRAKNLLKQGETPAMAGLILDGRVTLLDTVHSGLKKAGPLQKPSGAHKKTGRGLACSMPIFDIGGLSAYHRKGTGAGVELLSDGSVVVFSGACELGTGISTVLAQIAAEELGIGLERVSVICGDSLAAPKAGPTVASRSTYTAGNAVRLAAQQVKATVIEKASSILEAPSAILKVAEGRVFVEELPDRMVLLREVAAACFEEGTRLRGDSWFSSSHAAFGQTFMTTVADVEVDTETGEVTVLNVVAAHDIGKALNPLNTRGQLLGGALQGIGYALQEDLSAENGVVRKESFSEYIILSSADMPPGLQYVVVEEPYATGPYGAKAVGEHGMVTAPPAILNAICDAVGIRILNPPATPDKVLRALKEAGHR